MMIVGSIATVSSLAAQNIADSTTTIESSSVAEPLQQIYDIDQIWDQANTAYVNANYKAAIDDYNKILSMGVSSAKIYYNIANAYFKDNQIGKAILNYRRASLLAPSDKDIAYNLRIITATHVKDRIEEVPELFIVSFFRSIRGSLSSNMWATISLVLLLIAMSSTIVYLISRKNRLRKVGFFVSLACIALFVVSLIFAINQRKEFMLHNEAIVMSSAVAVKSSPNSSSKDIFILHEGTAVEINSTLADWSEISIADGNKGWIPNRSIERISIVE